MPGLSVEDYHIGWVCALPKEMTAALSMLDEEHQMLEGQPHNDDNNYALGRIHNHNVVVACMPAGADGLVNAANVARNMARTFPALRVCLMVGIGGGIPNLGKGIDIRLGDIVVSQPDGTLGGVVQYDKGKAESGGKFILKGQLNQPPLVVLQTLARLQAEHDGRDSWVPDYIKRRSSESRRWKKPGTPFLRPQTASTAENVSTAVNAATAQIVTTAEIMIKIVKA
jgi:hypothetical protein